MPVATFSANFNNLDAIRDFVGGIAEQAGFSGKEVYAIQLCTDEACSNVVEHAYAGIEGGDIEVTCDVKDDALTVVIHDHGVEFDITKVKKPNLGKKLEEREIGGLGVYLIQKLMDDVRFESSAKTGNYLTMVKRKSRGA
ncbi:MAG: ATP-binding protein [Chloroflexota bacterium]